MEEIDDDGELSEENIINVIDNNNSINNLNQDLSLNDKNNKNKIIEKLAEKININPLNLTSYNFAKYNLSYETIHRETFNIDALIYYLSTREKIGIVDELINSLYEKFQNDSLFYIPQLCSFLSYKDYTTPIENFLLDSCIDRMKFSLIVFWTTVSNQKCKKMEELQQNIQTTLVNNRRCSLKSNNNGLNNYKKKILDYENKIIQESIFKEFKLDYFDYVFNFYENLPNLCAKLKDTSKKKRNNVLAEYLNKYNTKIKKMKEEAKSNIPQSCDVVTNFFYEGILLPFDDNIDSSDGFCDIIVKFIPELSMCYHSKARVPILLTVECVKLFEIQEKEKLKEDIKSEKIDSGNIINVIKKNIDNNIDNSNKIKKAKTTKDDEYFIYIPDESKSKLTEVFDCKFSDLIKFYRSKSNYKYYDTYSLKSFIFKSNDDLRQELLTLQLIKKMKLIFESNRINLKLFPYEILTTSSESGLIEFLPNTISIDQFKKKYSEKDLNTFYREAFGDDFYIAQRNFCESLAAYSLVCYLLEIRDRHNGNILIDIEGNLIHIDFGFILGIGPGGTNFEQAPFKLTEEYVNILDGIDSTMFNYFKSLLYIGFIEIRKHFETLWQIIEITYRGNNELPCFKDRDIDEIKQLFQSKFLFEEPELDLPNFVDPLIEKCYDNSRTNNYDKYQSLTNGISY
jgi:hypothetical protein